MFALGYCCRFRIVFDQGAVLSLLGGAECWSVGAQSRKCHRQSPETDRPTDVLARTVVLVWQCPLRVTSGISALAPVRSQYLQLRTPVCRKRKFGFCVAASKPFGARRSSVVPAQSAVAKLDPARFFSPARDPGSALPHRWPPNRPATASPGRGPTRPGPARNRYRYHGGRRKPGARHSGPPARRRRC